MGTSLFSNCGAAILFFKGLSPISKYNYQYKHMLVYDCQSHKQDHMYIFTTVKTIDTWWVIQTWRWMSDRRTWYLHMNLSNYCFVYIIVFLGREASFAGYFFTTSVCQSIRFYSDFFGLTWAHFHMKLAVFRYICRLTSTFRTVKVSDPESVPREIWKPDPDPDISVLKICILFYVDF